MMIDDVSCIDIDLPAYAGYDYYMVPTDSAFIGRQPDVGIDEACTWYQLPNMATPIATVAGLYVKPAATTTYVVRQEICAGIKWDTVIVFKSAVGIEAQQLLEKDLRLFPVPAHTELNLGWSSAAFEKTFDSFEIVNDLGQVCNQGQLFYNNKEAGIDIQNLPNGLYLLRLKSVTATTVSKPFVISH